MHPTDKMPPRYIMEGSPPGPSRWLQQSFDRIAQPVPNLWDTLATRCLVSRQFVKSTVLAACYGADLDPWLKHIVLGELERLKL